MNKHRPSTALRQAVSELAEENSLSPSELEQLREISRDQPALPSRRRWLSVAAGVGAVSLGGLLGVGLMGRGNQAYAMAEEIAFNHLRGAPLDIQSGDLEELRRAFAGLGFGLLDAAEVENVPGQLAGGRFCSVAAVPAAMLIYQTDHGPVTVYQARFDERRHRGAANMDRGEPGHVIFSAGVKVCLCHTRGILLATASSGELA